MTFSSTSDVLAAIVAGGASTRFGSPKALACVETERVVDRVARALRGATAQDEVIAIVNDEALARAIGLPHVPDARPGAGALGGLHAALLTARQLGKSGTLVAGCDMPFLSEALLRNILERRHAHDAVLPESEGPRGMEPLCAWYGTACIPALESALDRGDARMIGFHADVDVHRIPLDEVRVFGDPTLLFMNLNTVADLHRAQRVARERP